MCLLPCGRVLAGLAVVRYEARPHRDHTDTALSGAYATSDPHGEPTPHGCGCRSLFVGKDISRFTTHTLAPGPPGLRHAQRRAALLELSGKSGSGARFF